VNDLAPYFWYLAGSICFGVGTVLVILEKIAR
jgi:hypothetical protein